MTLLDRILEHNHEFVEKKDYEKFQTTKYPNKKVVILSCMDTRLVELLPHAMNVKNGDAKLIKNAGAVISHPYGSIMRSIIIAVYTLKADEVMVVGHHGCGMVGLEPNMIMDIAKERGIDMDMIEKLEFSGIDLKSFLTGFDKVEDNVEHSVKMIKNHPLLPGDIPVHGLVIDPENGKLDVVVNGYENVKI